MDVNGVRLHYEEHGAGEPILCIHGAGSSALLWSDALPELARLGRVIAYDRRGCSRSQRPEPYKTTVAEHAADAAALLGALGIESAIVIARSWGGAVAVELALSHPERVVALALLEGDALGLSSDGLEWTRRIRDRLTAVAASDGPDAVYGALVEEILGEGAWESFPEEVRAILIPNGPALLAELAYVAGPNPGRDEVATIDAPTLVVVADDSPAPQRAMAEALAETIPGATLARIGGGHMIDPATPEVLEFVGRHAASG